MIEDKELMARIRTFVKAKRVPYGYLVEEMGYTPVHISRVLNGKTASSYKFNKLLIMALSKFTYRDYKELQDTLEGSIWHSLFLSL